MQANFLSMCLTTRRASFTVHVLLGIDTDLVPEEAFGQGPVVHLLPLVVEAAVYQLPHIAVNG